MTPSEQASTANTLRRPTTGASQLGTHTAAPPRAKEPPHTAQRTR